MLGRLSRQPYLMLTLTALIWAANAIAGKMAVGHVSPFLLTFLRWIIAFAILLPLAWPVLRRDAALIRRHWPFLALLAAIGFTLFNNLFYVAMLFTSALNGAIEQAAMPLFVFIFNFVLFRIRVAWLSVAGYALTMIGVVITVTHGEPLMLLSQPVNIGDALLVLAVIFYGLFSVLLVRKPPLHWLSLITVLSGFAALTSLPGMLWEYASGNMIWPDAKGWAITAYTAILPSIAAQAMWIRGLEMIGSNRGGIFINLVPVFAAIMAVTILGEEFHFYHALAMALVILGLWLAQRLGKTG